MKSYTTAEIAKLIKMDISSIAKWADNGIITVFSTPGGHRRVLEKDLFSFLSKYNMPIPIELEKYNKKIKLLVYDDDDAEIELIRKVVEDNYKEYDVNTVTEYDSFIQSVDNNVYDLILVDFYLSLGNINGVECIKTLRTKGKKTPIILITGNDNKEIAKQVLDVGGQDYIVKQISYFDLILKLGFFRDSFFSEKRIGSSNGSVSLKEKASLFFKTNEKLYQKMFVNDDDIRLLLDPDTGEVLDANIRALIYLNRSLEELKETNITSILKTTKKDILHDLKIGLFGNKILNYKSILPKGNINDVEVYLSALCFEENYIISLTVSPKFDLTDNS